MAIVRTVLLPTVAGLASVLFAGVLDAANAPAERRAVLLSAAKRRGAEVVSVLTRALDDPNMVVRRTAARILARRGVDARPALEKATANSDALVRKTALQALWNAFPEQADHWFGVALKDAEPSTRLLAVRQLAARRPRTAAGDALLARAAKGGDARIRAVAVRALWPFHRADRSIRRRSDWDHTITVLQTLRMPCDDWRFHLDRKREGHLKKWFMPEFDDSQWPKIAIEQAWQKAGVDYIGVAWYRRWIDLPAKPTKMNAIEICLDGVDECAWVWINGRYVGDHDVGPAGWDKPFTLDVSDEVMWGKPNLVVIRAMNTAHAGGVWRPVYFEILK